MEAKSKVKCERKGSLLHDLEELQGLNKRKKCAVKEFSACHGAFGETDLPKCFAFDEHCNDPRPP